MLVKINGKLIVRTLQVFQSVERAETWLRSPNQMLQGLTPLEALKTEEGAARVEKQLNWYSGSHVQTINQNARQAE